MKTLIALTLAAVALVCATPNVNAQVDTGPVANLIGGTNRILLATSNVYTADIPAQRGSQVAIQCSFKMTGAGATSNIWWYVDASVDGSTWNPRVHTLGAAANGTTQVIFQTNINVGAMPFLRLSSVYNTNTIAVTNLDMRYAIKTGI